tara:strand:- start:915 stop:1859 length:945 start_codon:yes stop_codon:yes gene_type:complete
MGSSRSTSGGGGSSNKPKKVKVQTYEQFKTPEGRAAAVNRQNQILASTRTNTGAFANQEKELNKAGFTLSADKSSVLKDGKTVAGVTSSGGMFSGSSEVNKIIKDSQTAQGIPVTRDQTQPMTKEGRYINRAVTTGETLRNLETLDEVSKAREAEYQKALNYGRGIQPAPTITDPTRVVASTPTLSEVGGDIARGLFGGQAPTVNYIRGSYQAEPVKGLVPTIADAAISGTLSPAYNLLKSGVGFFQNNKDGGGTSGGGQNAGQQALAADATEFAENERKKRIKLAGVQGDAIADSTRKFITATNRTFGGGKVT